MDFDTGTVVTFFFTRETDLFVVEVVLLSTGRKMGRGVNNRRVLTLPSGFLGEFDLKLFVSYLSLRLGLGLLFVRRREDAKGHGDAGFKVQVGGLLGARIVSSSTFRSNGLMRKVEQEDSSCSLLFTS